MIIVRFGTEYQYTVRHIRYQNTVKIIRSGWSLALGLTLPSLTLLI